MKWLELFEKRRKWAERSYHTVLALTKDEAVADFLSFLDDYCGHWMINLVVDHDDQAVDCHDAIVMEDFVNCVKSRLDNDPDSSLILTKTESNFPKIILHGHIPPYPDSMGVDEWKKLAREAATKVVTHRLNHYRWHKRPFSCYAELFLHNLSFTPEMFGKWLDGDHE